ncbi:UNVERIFIED_CONTAM: hypothetical protein K2H54_040921 [Gekko kuhli]
MLPVALAPPSASLDLTTRKVPKLLLVSRAASEPPAKKKRKVKHLSPFFDHLYSWCEVCQPRCPSTLPPQNWLPVPLERMFSKAKPRTSSPSIKLQGMSPSTDDEVSEVPIPPLVSFPSGMKASDLPGSDPSPMQQFQWRPHRLLGSSGSFHNGVNGTSTNLHGLTYSSGEGPPEPIVQGRVLQCWHSYSTLLPPWNCSTPTLWEQGHMDPTSNLKPQMTCFLVAEVLRSKQKAGGQASPPNKEGHNLDSMDDWMIVASSEEELQYLVDITI